MGKTVRKNEDVYTKDIHDVKKEKKLRKIGRMMKSRKGQAKVLKLNTEEDQ